MAAFFQVRGILPETFQKLYKKNMWYFLESSNFTKKQLPDFPGSKIAIETPRQCVKSVHIFFVHLCMGIRVQEMLVFWKLLSTYLNG